MNKDNLVQEIQERAENKNALILAHNYQPPEIQDMAHMTGDSLELARKASNSDSDILVFCGVRFMAESASILAPGKMVLLPEDSAGCAMAEMVTAEDVRVLRKKHPRAAVVTYINSTADVKAESDVICTSANALKIVEALEEDEIIFLPDKNLGGWVARNSQKNIHLFSGYCPCHNDTQLKDLEAIREAYPDALIMVHPESPPAVSEQADHVFSTGEMLRFARGTSSRRIVVGTEEGMLHPLRKERPDIEFIPLRDGFICDDMKKITLEHVRDSLAGEKTVITVARERADRAREALKRMLELS
jgi:quinolinate synthase